MPITDDQKLTETLQQTANHSRNSTIPTKGGSAISTTSPASSSGVDSPSINDTAVPSMSSLSLHDNNDNTSDDLTRPATNSKDSASSPLPSRLKLRKPALHDPSFHGPSPEWLSGKWHIAHSTLPTWKDKRNVTITYSLTSDERLEDKVEFDPIFGGVRSVSGKQVASPKSQSNRTASPTASPRGSLEGSRKGSGAEGTGKAGRPGRLVRMNTVEAHEAGVSANDDQGEVVDWDWHGKGLIKLASAHWEILGWGGDEGKEWVVTYFKKTYMTPEGVNLYVRDISVASEDFVNRVKSAMLNLGHPGVEKLVPQIFEVQRK